jgi:hypothetical protein
VDPLGGLVSKDLSGSRFPFQELTAGCLTLTCLTLKQLRSWIDGNHHRYQDPGRTRFPSQGDQDPYAHDRLARPRLLLAQSGDYHDNNDVLLFGIYPALGFDVQGASRRCRSRGRPI